MSKKIISLFLSISIPLLAFGQKDFDGRKFEQMGTVLPTPNDYRTASGAPGKNYWQQQADYDIEVELDDEKQAIQGKESVTYHNNSPDHLMYLWLQLDQNMRRKDSDKYQSQTNQIRENLTGREIREIVGPEEDLGFQILNIKDLQGNSIPYVINKTMMRLDIPEVLEPNGQYTFRIEWKYNINNRKADRARSGKEFFEKDGNYLYSIAQFFPRLAVYDDINGWQHKQFLGRGEFTLPFGNYKVKITVPADHIVGATGVLQNPEEVLTSEQRQKLEQSKTSSDPVIIVSQEEVIKKEKNRSNEKKTWVYHAENVRDFAFVSSRKLIWDAMGVEIDGRIVMAMSYYAKEANPLYETYSTRAVAHTLKSYSDYTIPYPYPVAISAEADMGMEYPMIAFNYGRPNSDGTYSNRLKYGMISVIIHEVGHNFFPMIINSDERQWSWMDEGLNSFVQYIAEKAWDPDYPSQRGPTEKIIPYMKGSKESMVPIMTNPEQVKQHGSNAYAKPATALNILRNTVMGPDLFDYAFKEYCRRWAFKHPSPADFFRTMEDASAVDLDWFWQGWFYTTDHVDLEISDVTWYKYDLELTKEIASSKSKRRNQKNSEMDLPDKGYTDTEVITAEDKLNNYQLLTTSLSNADELLKSDQNYYEINLQNHGGLVMPVILKFHFRDETDEIVKLPAEIWRKDEKEITKVFVFEKEVESIEMDPFSETADVNEHNNHYPPKDIPSRFDEYKKKKDK